MRNVFRTEPIREPSIIGFVIKDTIVLSFLLTLREKTREHHERLEARMDLPDSITTDADYRRLLTRLFGFYAPVEASLDANRWRPQWEAIGLPDMPERSRKTDLLKQDLLYLGVSEAEQQRLPRDLGKIVETDDFASIIGSTYVLEGATLGGQLIGRHIEKTLGSVLREHGMAFYNGYGSQTGVRWQRFRQAVDTFAMQEAEAGRGEQSIEKAVDAAKRVFSELEWWLFEERGDNG